MVELGADRAVDPDAQAAVTDFLDYTEYLPSDLIRSLTLIRGLDDKYDSDASALHDLTKTYGSLPTIDPTIRPDAQKLRLQIALNLDQALNARESAFAEANRLLEVAERHQNRLKSIVAKLKAIPKPPSRDPSPVAPSSTQKRSRAGRKLENGMSTTRLTLNPPRGTAVAAAILNRPRGRRVTVPGEVMPPFDPDEAIASTEVSDWESPPPSPPRPILKLKQPKPPKERLEVEPKPPRAPREHVSYRKPTPPPDDAELGSKYRPWTHLTEYEMYKLRKRMKKNHNWEPSPIMIKRELEARGRGWDNYYKAKAEAQASGTKFIDVNDKPQPKVTKPEPAPAAPAAPSPTTIVVAATPIATPVAKPKTAKKKEPSKDKTKDPARDRAALAAQEAELAARRLGDIGSAFKNLFSPLSNALASLNRSASSPTANSVTTGRKSGKTSRKRKLDDVAVSTSPSAEPDPQKKKQKTAAPKPSPLATSSEPPQQSAGTIKIPALKLNVTAQSSVVSEAATPASATRAASAARSSVAPKAEDLTPPPATRLSASRKSTAAPDDAITVTTTASSVATATRSSQRASATPTAPAPQTPITESSPKNLPTAASRRSKREIPGTVLQSTQDGGAAISVSSRKTKPGKRTKSHKATTSNSSPEIRVDVDGSTEIVDPDEERYCICKDVSFGEMICCELEDKVRHSDLKDRVYANSEQCEVGMWFHMECVGLKELPARTVKWYCPGCRKKYHKGEHTDGFVGRGFK
jgi:hypothetical protein